MYRVLFWMIFLPHASPGKTSSPLQNIRVNTQASSTYSNFYSLLRRIVISRCLFSISGREVASCRHYSPSGLLALFKLTAAQVLSNNNMIPLTLREVSKYFYVSSWYFILMQFRFVDESISGKKKINDVLFWFFVLFGFPCFSFFSFFCRYSNFRRLAPATFNPKYGNGLAKHYHFTPEG